MLVDMAAKRLDEAGKVIRIDIVTPFNSALAMFWPGSRPVSFSRMNLGASSSDVVQF